MPTTFYQANPLLKAARVKHQYTQEQMVEFLKCKDDPIYFIKNYIKIISLDSGLINFNLFEYQENFINCIHNNRMVISMQPRQMGKTQTVAAYLVWYITFNNNKTVAILANKAPAAREVMSRMQLMIENLPKWIQQGVTEWNKGSIKFENNCTAFTASTSSSGIRGKSCNLVYVDEVAIVPNTIADAFFTSTYPTISSGNTTKIILTSTPLGLNHFWKFWQEAESGVNGFKPLRVNYWEHPKRDKSWAEDQRKLLGEVKYNQEVLCEFLGSSKTLISPEVISRLAVENPVYEKDGLRIYQAPFKGNLEENKSMGSYVLVADTSSGIGGDASAFSIIRVDTVPYRVVATYANSFISPLLFPNVIHKWATEYNEAHVLIELNKSEQVPYILYNELEYENIIYVTRTSKGQIMTNGFNSTGINNLGLIQTKNTKRIGCTMLKELIENNKLIVTDATTISEISTFIEQKNSYSADDGYHDDLVMTLVTFGWLTTQTEFRGIVDVDIKQQLYKMRIEAIEQESLPIGYFDNGLSEPTGETWVTYQVH